MQTAVALCYFCENHGPRVVTTCQPMRDCDQSQSNCTQKMEKPQRTAAEKEQRSSAIEADEEDEDEFYGDPYAGNEIVDDELRCAACSSFEQGMGLISNDHEAEISYVSTQMPVNERLNRVLKQVCLRSLSMEISAPLSDLRQTNLDSNPASTSSTNDPSHHSYQKCQPSGFFREDSERDGVVLFGEDDQWYTLSYTFRLKDAKARGFRRSYSMVVISMDKLLLLRNYDFLVDKLGEIIGKMQALTDTFFALEQDKDKDLRLASNVSISSKGPQHWLPHQFYPKQYTLDTKRSLRVISNSETIFTTIHRQMLSLLKTLNALDRDIVLEGCPTQDTLIVTELKHSNLLEERELVTELSPPQALAHLANLRVIVDRLTENNGQHDQNVTLLTTLIWQVVVGGQIVVRSSSLSARHLFLLALVQLVPVGCVRLSSNSSQYSYPHKYNFLGCPLTVQIPDDTLPEIILFTLTRNEQFDGVELERKQGLDSLKHFNFRVDSWPEKLELERPSIVGRYEQLLLDPVLNDITLSSALQSTRNDWLNNAKLIFQVRHQQNAIDLDRVLRIIKCKQQDSPVILFWQKGLSRRYKKVVLNMTSNSATNTKRDGGT